MRRFNEICLGIALVVLVVLMAMCVFGSPAVDTLKHLICVLALALFFLGLSLWRWAVAR